MKNLEQIRAAAALEPARDLDKSAVNKLPALILRNGLLATIAFCASESSGENRSHMARALLATARHLASRGMVSQNYQELKDFARDLSRQSSQNLQHATAEALAFIAYLRRFAKKSEERTES